jgi:multidrug efflux system outer membrane protein
MITTIPPSPLLRWVLPLSVALGSTWLLSGCALQPNAATQMPAGPARWALAEQPPANASGPDAAAADPRWWLALDDPALPRLIAAAEASAPTLAIALARLDEARALQQASGAGALPQAQGVVGSSRANGGNGGNSTSPLTRSSASLNLSWEIDLFGRLGHNRAAAQARLDARDADARATRLSLQASLASTLLARRACGELLTAQKQDLQSRETTLKLTERKLQAGLVPEADRARVQSGLAEARGNLATSRGQCQQLSQSLVALSTLSREEVDSFFTAPRTLASAPAYALKLPAAVLASHPSLQAAVRTADAAFEDVGAARAARLPSLSLSGLLGRQWLGINGSTVGSDQWSLGASLAGALFDGGAGAANVSASRARYAQAMAQLQQTLLSTVQDVENALSSLAAAQARDEQAQAGLNAAQRLFDASDASWRAGRLSLFELEDARRTLQAAQSNLIAARRDHTQAWVALVKASGNALSGV